MKLKVLTLEGLSTFKSALLSLFTKEQIGLSNVENKSSEEIREEITYENVVNALGYAEVVVEKQDYMNTDGLDYSKLTSTVYYFIVYIPKQQGSLKNSIKTPNRQADFPPRNKSSCYRNHGTQKDEYL